MKPMQAYDERSAEILDSLIEAVGNTDAIRAAIRSAYMLGQCDGRLEQTAQTLVTMQRIQVGA